MQTKFSHPKRTFRSDEDKFAIFNWDWVEYEEEVDQGGSTLPWDKEKKIIWTSEDETLLYEAILDIMRAHSWEVPWKQRHKAWKDKLYIRFFERKGKLKASPIRRSFILPYNKKMTQIEKKFQTAYEDLRSKWVHVEMDSIIVPVKEWEEMKLKVDMLWYAPNMPGCQEEMKELEKELTQ